MKTSLTVSMEYLYSCHLFSVGHHIAHMDISNVFFQAEARHNISESCRISKGAFALQWCICLHESIKYKNSRICLVALRTLTGLTAPSGFNRAPHAAHSPRPQGSPRVVPQQGRSPARHSPARPWVPELGSAAGPCLGLASAHSHPQGSAPWPWLGLPLVPPACPATLSCRALPCHPAELQQEPQPMCLSSL